MTTPSQPAPQAGLCIGGVGLIRGSIKGCGPAMVEVGREFNPILATLSWFPSAPFRYVSLIIRYGDKTDLDTEFTPIRKRTGELPVAIQISMEEARARSRNHADLVALFRYLTLIALHAVASRYKLDASFLPTPAKPENI